ncbi:MAG: hypothetical protein ACI8RZ_001866, partial [Myxococcota bacterium]
AEMGESLKFGGTANLVSTSPPCLLHTAPRIGSQSASDRHLPKLTGRSGEHFGSTPARVHETGTRTVSLYRHLDVVIDISI